MRGHFSAEASLKMKTRIAQNRNSVRAAHTFISQSMSIWFETCCNMFHMVQYGFICFDVF